MTKEQRLEELIAELTRLHEQALRIEGAILMLRELIEKEQAQTTEAAPQE